MKVKQVTGQMLRRSLRTMPSWASTPEGLKQLQPRVGEDREADEPTRGNRTQLSPLPRQGLNTCVPNNSARRCAIQPLPG
jgi:hypothetical protein